MTDIRPAHHDYGEAIAAAARAYVAATRIEECPQEEEAAYEKLAWLIDAEVHGWDPDDYRPETEP